MAKQKQPADIDEVVKELSEERVQDNYELPPATVDPGPTDEEAVADLFSKIPANEGYYVKIYRVAPVPKEFGQRKVFLGDITQPEIVGDLESELLKQAQARGWMDGIYELKLMQHDRPGVLASRRITIQVPKATAPLNANGNGDGPVATNPYEQIHQTAQLIKELTESATSNTTDTSTISQAIMEAYKLGASQTPKTPPQTANDLLTVARVIKELAPPIPTSNSDMVTLLKEVIATQKSPQVDTLEMLTKLKALLPEPKSTDSLDSTVNLLTKLLPLMQSLGGEGGNASAAVELIRALAPQAGQIISDVTGTLNKVIDAKTTPRKPMPASATAVPPPQISTTPKEKPMLPVFAAIKDAIEKEDITFYPQLEELLLRVMTPQQFSDLVEGKTAAEEVLTEVGKYGGAYFVSEKARSYFDSFLADLRARKSKEFVAVCNTCNAEIVFDSKEEFETDNTCPECKNPLTPISVGPETETIMNTMTELTPAALEKPSPEKEE